MKKLDAIARIRTHENPSTGINHDYFNQIMNLTARLLGFRDKPGEPISEELQEHIRERIGKFLTYSEYLKRYIELETGMYESIEDGLTKYYENALKNVHFFKKVLFLSYNNRIEILSEMGLFIMFQGVGFFSC